MAEETSTRPRQSWETRIALLEQQNGQIEKRQDQQDQKMTDLANKFDERFDKMEALIVELKNKNPVMDFIKEKWQVVTLLIVILVGQPSLDVLKLLIRVLFPQAGIQ